MEVCTKIIYIFLNNKNVQWEASRPPLIYYTVYGDVVNRIVIYVKFFDNKQNGANFGLIEPISTTDIGNKLINTIIWSLSHNEDPGQSYFVQNKY